jgi:hypothetical protein
MRTARIHRSRPIFQQCRRRLHQRTGRVDQVIDDQTGAAVHIADDVHDFGHVHFHAALVDDGQSGIHLFGEESGALHAAGIRRYHRKVRQIQILEVADQHGRAEQVIHRDIKEPLQLRRMQIDDQGSIRARRGQKIGNKL